MADRQLAADFSTSTSTTSATTAAASGLLSLTRLLPSAQVVNAVVLSAVLATTTATADVGKLRATPVGIALAITRNAPTVTVEHSISVSLSDTTATGAPQIGMPYPLDATLTDTTATQTAAIDVGRNFPATLTDTTATQAVALDIGRNFPATLADTTSTAGVIGLRLPVTVTFADASLTATAPLNFGYGLVASLATSTSATAALRVTHDLPVAFTDTTATTSAAIAATTATTVTVSKPTGATVGDQLVAVVGHAGTGTLAASGWTQILTRAGSGITLYVLRKLVAADDPASYTFALSANTAMSVGVVALSGIDALSPVLASASQANGSNSDAIAPSITPGSTGLLLYAAAWAGNTRATPPGGMTEQADAGAGTASIYAATQTVSAGATGTRSVSVSGSPPSAAALIAFLPAQATGTKSGAMVPGTTIVKESLALDFGVSGNGYYEVSAIDGLNGANAPYAQTVKWTGHPTNKTVTTRTGNLNGLFGQADEYGLYAGTGTTDADQYLRMSTQAMLSNNVPLRMFDSGTQVVGLEKIGGKWNFWIGTSPSDKRLSWNGSGLSVSGYLTVGSAASDINNGSTTINGGKITTGSITANQIASGSITANQIASGTITTSQINFSPVLTGSVVASINASAEGVRIQGSKIQIDGTVTFGTGYDPSTKITTGGAASDINNNTTTINGGKITTGSIKADQIDSGAITATKLNVSSLSAVNTNTGALTVSGALTVNSSGSFVAGGGAITLDTSGLTMAITDAKFGASTMQWYRSGTRYMSFGVQVDLGAPVTAFIETPLGFYLSAASVSVGSASFTSGNISAGAISASSLAASGAITTGGNAVWHAGNFSPSSYAPLSGGQFTGRIGINQAQPSGSVWLDVNGQVYIRANSTIEGAWYLKAVTVPSQFSGFLVLAYDGTNLKARLPDGTLKTITWS